MKTISDKLHAVFIKPSATAKVIVCLKRKGAGRPALRLAISGFLLLAAMETADAAVYVIDGRSGPWLYSNGGLNSGFQYGVGDQLSPTLVSGLSFGQQVTLTYQSGTVAGSQTLPFFDANGDTSQPNPPTTSNGAFPSFFMPLSNSTFYVELVGTFADSQGQVVGRPFPVGDGPIVLSVPSGASRLQLGVNDNLFGDNRGSWSVDVALSSIPEPGSIGLIATGIVAFSLRRWSRLQGSGGTAT